MKDPHHALKHLTRICLLADLTLMVAWSPEEAGRIIETYKIYQNKPPDMIMEKQEADPHLKVCDFYKVLSVINTVYYLYTVQIAEQFTIRLKVYNCKIKTELLSHTRTCTDTELCRNAYDFHNKPNGL